MTKESKKEEIKNVHTRLITLSNTFEVMTQVLDRGDMEISALLLEKILISLKRLLSLAKKQSRSHEAYIDVLLETHMPDFESDLEKVASLSTRTQEGDPSVTEKELNGLADRVEHYLSVSRKGMRVLFPRKGLRSSLIHFWNKGKKAIFLSAAVGALLAAALAGYSWWRGQRYSLQCEIFSDQKLNQFHKRTKNTAVNFDWGYAAPFLGFKVDDFSLRWTGYVFIPEAGPYVFSTEADDGVVLWVHEQKVIDDWNSHAKTKNTGEIYLEAGCQPLKLEYFENNAAASVNLMWKKPGMSEEVTIPSVSFRSEKKYCSQ